MPQIADALEPPYYAVIFVANPTQDRQDYAETAGRMVQLASQMPGFLGLEAAHERTGGEIVVSYWRDEAAIARWKQEAEHLVAQRRGREQWYAGYVVRVAKVERAYSFFRDASPSADSSAGAALRGTPRARARATR